MTDTNVSPIVKMMKMLLITATLVVALASCSDDDDPVPAAPAISNFEFGEGGTHATSGTAYKGSDIHMEAEISSEATISSIVVSIHAHDLTPGEGEVAWDFEQAYADSKYLVRNATFHEHIDIPSNIPAGQYHITLTVTDQRGNSTEVEGDLEILDAITLSNLSIDESVSRGNDFHTEFTINAVKGIQHIIVDIHGHDLTIGEGDEEWHYEAEFEEGYHGETEAVFHEHIDVPATAPVGEYHIAITIEDEDGHTLTFETHIDVVAP